MIRRHSFSIILSMAVFFSLGCLGFTPVAAADEPTVLITGSSRGIGFALTRVYAERGWHVIATCRTPSKATDLQTLAAEHENVTIEELDVTDDGEIASLAEKYNGRPIDILINNAGIPGDRTKQKLGNFDYAVFDQVMAVNVHGPLRMAQAFLDHVEASDQKKIITISSNGGSIAGTQRARGLTYFYKSSKAALHMIMRSLSLELKERGIVVGLVSPGFVHTDFAGGVYIQGMIEPEESAAAVTAVIDDYGMEKSGLLFSHEGEQMPW